MELQRADYWAGSHVGQVKVWLNEDPKGTYAEAVIGYKDALVPWLERFGFVGMAAHVAELRTVRPIMYMVFMTVREELGGRGIGTAMIRELLGIARENGVERALLQRDSNSRSSDKALERLYKRAGFKNFDIPNEDEDDPLPAMEISLR